MQQLKFSEYLAKKLEEKKSVPADDFLLEIKKQMKLHKPLLDKLKDA